LVIAQKEVGLTKQPAKNAGISIALTISDQNRFEQCLNDKLSIKSSDKILEDSNPNKSNNKFNDSNDSNPNMTQTMRVFMDSTFKGYIKVTDIEELSTPGRYLMNYQL
jgi:hypothetical protein